jgi:signal transduction histidine kinase/CheY-like chemotaxis protein
VKTLLVLAQHPDFAESVRSVLNPEDYRTVHRVSVEEAEPILGRGLLDGCIIDVELAGVQGIWIIEKVRRQVPRCPVIVYTGSHHWEWEEDAFVHGVVHVLAKPVRARILTTVLQRLWPTETRGPGSVALIPAPQRAPEPVRTSDTTHFALQNSSFQTLEVLRDFSAILSHSLNSEALLKQFLLLLREIVGVNRATIFLRQPIAGFAESRPGLEKQRLRSACSIGLSPSLLEHFELSSDAGIGGYVCRQGRILRQNSFEAQNDMEVQKEFELLGAQVAVPILDRETLIGVTVLDGRVTGEPLTNAELELIFHLLEQLGLAIKNIWLHDQLSANHKTIAEVLQQLSSACIVVGSDLTILHANKSARLHFARSGRRGADLEFSDLPQVLGSKVYQVLRTGAGIATFKYHPDDSPNTVYHITIVPFQKQDSVLPASALLLAEDHTQTELLQRLEIEAANLRLVKSMAERLAHEIGNCLVPLSTHQQLLSKKYEDPEFRASLDVALADGVKRISRLINQMRFLAKDSISAREVFPVSQLVEEAYQEAVKHQPVKAAQLKYNSGSQPITLSGDRASLKHALSEVMLNALQANPSSSKISVRMQTDTDSGGVEWVHIEVQDNGTGFSPDMARKVPEPFFTTRNVGMGLGLTVTRKIVETHRGKVEIAPPAEGQAGLVRISLPVAVA